MNNPIKILVPVTLALLSSGCVGMGPNTQEGAVKGAALGALAGAIIGNNSGGHGGRGAVIGAAAGAIAGGTLGNKEDHSRGTIYRSEGDATSERIYSEEPVAPAPKTDVMVVQSNPGTIWVPGHWFFSKDDYTWIPGHWETPPPRTRYYVPPHWKRRGQGFVYVRGYWQ